MLAEYALATVQRKQLEAGMRSITRATTPQRRSELARGLQQATQSPVRKRAGSPRRDPGSPGIFERLAAEQKGDAHAKREAELLKRELSELKAKPTLPPGSRRLTRDVPRGDALERLSSPLRTDPKYKPTARRSDELATDEFGSFKARPMPKYGEIHMLRDFENGCRIAMEHGADVATDVYSPGGSRLATVESPGMNTGEMSHLRRQLAAVRSRGLDEETLELVEGLFASIDAKTGGALLGSTLGPDEGDSDEMDAMAVSTPGVVGVERRRRSGQKKRQQPRRSGRKKGASQPARANSPRRQPYGRQLEPGDGDEAYSDEVNDHDQEMTDFDDIAMAGYSDDDDHAADAEVEAATPLTPRSNYAELSAIAAEAAAANAAQNTSPTDTGRSSPTAPFPPMEMSAETSQIICHAAKFVALHGPQFYKTLQSKHVSVPPHPRPQLDFLGLFLTEIVTIHRGTTRETARGGGYLSRIVPKRSISLSNGLSMSER
jgi:hypothetical protein